MRKQIALVFTFVLAFAALSANAQTPTFAYQGRLTDGTLPAAGTYQMQFLLFGSLAGSDQISTTLTFDGAGQNPPPVTVANGVFTVQLNFPGPWFAAGADRWLEIAVRKPTDPPGYTTLSPRQQLTSSPYSLRTLSAALADNVTGVVAVNNGGTGSSTQSGARTNLGAAASGANSDITSLTGEFTTPLSISRGGTGSTKQNFVDLTSAQTAAGNKTFSNTVTANTFSGGSGGLNMNNNLLRLRDAGDSNHGMLYNSTIDGPEFRAYNGFRWTNGENGATERMNLDVSGNLTITGTFNGTIAANSIGSGQITDGSLRIGDAAFYTAAITNINVPSLQANSCSAVSFIVAPYTPVAGDVVQIIPGSGVSQAVFMPPRILPGGSGSSVSVDLCNLRNTISTPITNGEVRIIVWRP